MQESVKSKAAHWPAHVGAERPALQTAFQRRRSQVQARAPETWWPLSDPPNQEWLLGLMGRDDKPKLQEQRKNSRWAGRRLPLQKSWPGVGVGVKNTPASQKLASISTSDAPKHQEQGPPWSLQPHPWVF